MATEIERKFLLATPPAETELGAGLHLRQGYLAGEGDVECRIRITPNASWITIKAGSGMSRTEVEVPVAQADAEALWPHTSGRRLEKVRYRVPVEGGVAEVDRYAGDLDGLWTVEVEFRSEGDAAGFVPPPWFGADVTHDRAWTNGALARHGRPDRPPADRTMNVR